ncbi:MAG TPA: hypothetical protein VF412_00185 [Bdellovibrio sp.]|uniref:hypothetical protein n=1 Tax=Bdellovibrio sp. TaxID=28201 RepID=UPI002EECEFC4
MYVRALLGLAFALLLAPKTFAAPSSIIPLDQISLMNFELGPQTPTVGNAFNVFIHLQTDWNSADKVRPVLQFTLDGQTAYALTPCPAPGLWVVPVVSTLATAGDHTVIANLYLEDQDQADYLRSAITSLTQEIGVLEAKILIEEDPAQKVILQTEHDNKVQERQNLMTALDATKTYVGSDTYKFTINSSK